MGKFFGKGWGSNPLAVSYLLSLYLCLKPMRNIYLSVKTSPSYRMNLLLRNSRSHPDV